MNLKTVKLDLPKLWKESSRMGGEDQVIVHVYHANPLTQIDPESIKDKDLPPRGNVVVTKVAVPTPGDGPIRDVFAGMKGLAESGLMPGWSAGKVDELMKGITQSKNAERPGESDMASDIEIIQCKDEETAWQTLKNKGLTPTQGLGVPIPGGMTIPGMPQNATMSQVLQSDMLKQFIPKGQLKDLEKMQAAVAHAQSQMPGIKENLEKRGVKYREGKIFGCKAVFMDSPNLTPPPGDKTSVATYKNTDGMGMGGGISVNTGGGSSESPMPPLPKYGEAYHSKMEMCMGFVCGRYVVGGPLLYAVNTLPLGKKPCYSLTKTKEVATTEKIEGKNFKSITIVPLPSTFAEEGYLHKEEVEEIYENIIAKIAR